MPTRDKRGVRLLTWTIFTLGTSLETKIICSISKFPDAMQIFYGPEVDNFAIRLGDDQEKYMIIRREDGTHTFSARFNAPVNPLATTTTRNEASAMHITALINYLAARSALEVAAGTHSEFSPL